MNPYIHVEIDFSTVSEQGFILMPSSIRDELLRRSQFIALTSKDATAFAHVESILSYGDEQVALCKVDALLNDDSKDEESRYSLLVAREMLSNLARPDRYSDSTRKAAVIALRNWDRDHGILSY